MAANRLSLVVLLLFFVYCAVNEVKSTIILIDADYKTVRVLITNDLSLSVTIEGPGIQPTEVPKTKKMNLMFKGTGTVTVEEDGKMILETKVGDGYLNLIRTHSNAHLMEVFGDVCISQRADQLNLAIRGNVDRKHTFTLSENKSTSKQSISVNGNNIAITQASDLINQNLAVFGAGEMNVFASTQDKSPENQSIAIRGRGSYCTSMSKDNGITIVSRKYEG